MKEKRQQQKKRNGMKKYCFLLVALWLSMLSVLAQDCYEKTRSKGIAAYESGKYPDAKSYFEFAESCPDKPAGHDLQAWIKKCDARITALRENESRRQQEAQRKAREAREAQEAEERKREAAQRQAREASETRRREEAQRRIDAIKNTEPPTRPPLPLPAPVQSLLAVSGNDFSFDASGRQEVVITITTQALNWSVSKDIAWCRTTPLSPSTLRLVCQSNTDETPRSDYFYIVADDKRERIDVRQSAAEDPVALGNELYLSKRFDEALKLYTIGASRGNLEAQYRLGKMYLDGIGVAPDRTQAMELFKSGAAARYSPAENAIGYLYETQDPPNYREAVRWYRKSAEDGYAIAQYNLGLLYQYGWGVRKNRKKAEKWFQKSADQGLPEAQEKLNIIK
jgi:TPR repeat protein